MALSLTEVPITSHGARAAMITSHSLTVARCSLVDSRPAVFDIRHHSSLSLAAGLIRSSPLAARQVRLRYKGHRYAIGGDFRAYTAAVSSITADRPVETPSPSSPSSPSSSSATPSTAESARKQPAKKGRRKGCRKSDGDAFLQEKLGATESSDDDEAFIAALASLTAVPENGNEGGFESSKEHELRVNGSDATLASILGSDGAGANGAPDTEGGRPLKPSGSVNSQNSAGAADVAAAGKAPRNAGDPYGKRVLGRAVVQWMARGMARMAQEVAEGELRGEGGLVGVAGESAGVVSLAQQFLLREPMPAGEQQRCHVAMSHYPTVLDHLQRELQGELKRRYGEGDDANRRDEEGEEGRSVAADVATPSAAADAATPSASAASTRTQESWSKSPSWNLLKQLMRSGEHRAILRQPATPPSSPLDTTATQQQQMQQQQEQRRQAVLASLLSPSSLQAAQQRINVYVATAAELLQSERDADLDTAAADISGGQPSLLSQKEEGERTEGVRETREGRRRKERGEWERGLAREGGTLTNLVAVGSTVGSTINSHTHTSAGSSSVHLLTLASPNAALLAASTLSPGDAVCLSPDWSRSSRIGTGAAAGNAGVGRVAPAVCYRGWVHSLGEDGQTLVLALEGKLGVGRSSSSSGYKGGASDSESDSSSSSSSRDGLSSPLHLQELFGVPLRVQRLSGLVDLTTYERNREALERLRTVALKASSPCRAVAATLFAAPRETPAAYAAEALTAAEQPEATPLAAPRAAPLAAEAQDEQAPQASSSFYSSASSSSSSSSLSFDPSQSAAIHLALDPSRPVVAIQGPPGTGKTSVVCEIITRAVRERPGGEEHGGEGQGREQQQQQQGGPAQQQEQKDGEEEGNSKQCKKKRRVLVCAPTNAAVDVLVERLASNGLNVVRIGNPVRLSPAVTPFSLDRLVAARLDSFRRDAARRRRDLRSDIRALIAESGSNPGSNPGSGSHGNSTRRRPDVRSNIRALAAESDANPTGNAARRRGGSQADNRPLRAALQKMLKRLAKVEREREREEVERVLGEAEVILCTTTGAGERIVQRLAREKEEGEKGKNGQKKGQTKGQNCSGFDLVVLDEAGQATEPSSWIPLLLGRRAVIAGDPCQLAPTVLSVAAQQGGLGVSLMERAQSEGLLERVGSGGVGGVGGEEEFGLRGGGGREEKQQRVLGVPPVIPMPMMMVPSRPYGGSLAMLRVQYRMHRAISDWCSVEMYQGQLSPAASVANHTLADIIAPSSPSSSLLSSSSPSSLSSPSSSPSSSPPPLPSLLTQPMVLIDTRSPRGLLHPCCEESPDTTGTGSLENQGEAELVVDHVQRLLAAGVPPGSIAVQSPYLAQVQLIRRRLEERLGGVVWPGAAGAGEGAGEGGDGELDVGAIEVASVDSFQGREADAVIISMVRSNPYGSVGFLGDRRRMNVAVTRGRRHVAVIADSATVGHNPFLRRLLLHIRSAGLVIGAHELPLSGNTPATSTPTAMSSPTATSAAPTTSTTTATSAKPGTSPTPSQEGTSVYTIGASLLPDDAFSLPSPTLPLDPVYASGGLSSSQPLPTAVVSAAPSNADGAANGAASAMPSPKAGASSNAGSKGMMRTAPLGPRVIARLRK